MIKLKQTNKAVSAEKIIFLYILRAASVPLLSVLGETLSRKEK